VKVKILRGTVVMNGRDHTQKIEAFGSFLVPVNKHQQFSFGPGAIVELSEPEAKRLIARKAAEAVADDTPLTEPTSVDEYLNPAETVMNRDGGRLERDTEGRWFSAGHPASE